VEDVMGNLQATHGLLIIQDRLNLLGCRMELISKPGEGTRIKIELPVERKSS
jgi:signal transduction histidine kinase